MLCEETVIKADTAVSAHFMCVEAGGGGITSLILSMTHWTNST